MTKQHALGKEGEALAIAFLRRHGYEILAKNYRYRKAEVDIIAQTEETIVAVEVKTRSTPEFGNPQDFVKPQQIQRLVTAMNHYMIENDLDFEVRFDIIAIIKNKQGTHLEHLKDAFYHF